MNEVSAMQLPPIAPQVRMLLDGTARLIGVGNRCKLVWLRTGGDIELIGGTGKNQWSWTNIYGPLGSFSLTCDSPSLPIHNPKVRYEKLPNGRWNIQAGADFDEPSFGGDKVGGGAEPVGAIGIGAIFSILGIVWSLLHPRATIHIPSSVEVDLILTSPELLEVAFVTPPTLQCVWGIQFSCEPQKLRLKPNHAAVDYRAMIFQRTEEWSW